MTTQTPTGRTAASPRGTRDRTWLVAAAAALWGVSALMREPLAQQMPAATVVFYEHLVIVVCLLPWLPSAVRAIRAASLRATVSVLVIGGGSSALAATLFTAAFTYGDPVTPQVLQKLQPVLAIALAAVLLGERLTGKYPLFAVPAIGGAWLLTFADPFSATLSGAMPALLAFGAAALWACGTVLGRAAGTELRPVHVTVLRFTVGLVAAGVIAASTGAGFAFTPLTWTNAGLLLLLALLPGLISLTAYYHGLQATPATRATLAELAFPLTAALVGVVVLGARLDVSQWIGFAVTLLAVTALGLHERRSERPAATAGP